MQVARHGDFYQVSWISGPRHNLLALSLSEGKGFNTTIEALPRKGECWHEKLDEKRILANVLEGMKSANQRFNTNFRVVKIQYVENDTGPEEIFSYLTQKIVEGLVRGEILDSKL